MICGIEFVDKVVQRGKGVNGVSFWCTLLWKRAGVRIPWVLSP